MTIISAIILGVVEGLTEYLPISSTFHLIWTAKLLGISHKDDFVKLFEVFIQSGAVLAVVVYYWSTIWKKRELLLHILVSFLPTAVIGLILYKLIKSFFDQPYLQLAVFLGVGAIFIYLEGMWRNRSFSRPLKTLTYQQAAFIGLAQSVAVIPGVSRSGAVILALMALGISREQAAKYSFLLAVPTLVAAAGYDLFKMRNTIIGHMDQTMILLIGTVAAFVSALVVIRWFISYLSKHSLTVFGWYRILLGIGLLILLRWGW